jgi:hypothetical protein
MIIESKAAAIHLHIYTILQSHNTAIRIQRKDIWGVLGYAAVQSFINQVKIRL